MTPAGSDTQQFEDAVRIFADAVAADSKSFVTTKPEDVLYDPVRALLKACGDIWSLETDSRQQVKAEGIGWPDLGVTTKGLLCGHVELKDPDISARPENYAASSQNGKQWRRYKALPNLIYTNGSEWSLYHAGTRTHRVRISDDIRDGANALATDRVPALRRLLWDFLTWEPVAPKSARGLAEFLAPLARFLRDEVSDALVRGSTPLKQLFDDWQGVLFAEADDKQFADAFTQTLTYALLLARFEGQVNMQHAFVVDTLRQRKHNLLATALDLLHTARDELSLPFEVLGRAIGVVDAPSVLRNPQMALLPDVAAAATVDDDPWLYFYEHFLAAYDRELRKSRGVYYTPVPIVRAQVRFANELLRDRFVKRDGFADSTVVVLDPACGTGAYPLAVIEDVKATARKQGAGMVPEKLRDLATRLHAFELLVGPYAVAHLRLSQQLLAESVTDRNPLVYLADTLESPDAPPKFPDSAFYAPLTDEHERAREVKRKTHVLVCLGNPPYDREQRAVDDAEGRRKGGWVRYGDDREGAPSPILEDFLRPVRDAGQGGELKNLYNDYVYFWRWALWKVFESDGEGGIVTFITASSYLLGPGFSGMRRRMRETFDDLWIIDLEGDNRGARKTENVFAIETPVAIAVGVRGGRPDRQRPARVWKTRIRGTAEEKLAQLDAIESLTDQRLQWRECSSEWGAAFAASGTGTYYEWPTVTDLFPWQHTGAEVKRTWPIGADPEVLAERWSVLLAQPPSARRAHFKETRDRKVEGQYPQLMAAGRDPAVANLGPDAPMASLEPYALRSFDRQYVIADSRLGDYLRPALWRTHSSKQTYITSLLTDVLGEGPAAVATGVVPDRHHFFGRGGKDVIPLYRDFEGLSPNVTKGLLERLGEAGTAQVTAERLFAYAYAVMAQPQYVDRFWDELEEWPPRLPLTRDVDLLSRVADLGERLLNLHTYGERFGGPDRAGIPEGEAQYTKAVSNSPDAYPEGYAYDRETRVLRVGKGEQAGEFAPVAP